MNYLRSHSTLVTVRRLTYGFALALFVGSFGVVARFAIAQPAMAPPTTAPPAIAPPTTTPSAQTKPARPADAQPTPPAVAQPTQPADARPTPPANAQPTLPATTHFAYGRATRMQPAAAPLTLRMLLDTVSRDYPAIRAAASRIRAADGARVASRAFGNPVLSYQTDQTPFPGGRPLVGLDRETMITATIPLEALYQRNPRAARGSAELRAAEADAISIRQRVGLDAANAFYRVAIAQVQVETVRELAGWLDTVVTYNRTRVREGAAAEADLIRATIERDRVLLDETMQSAELMQARAMLGVFAPSLTATGVNVSRGNAATSNSARLNPGMERVMVVVDDAPFSLPTAFATMNALPNAMAPGAEDQRVGATTNAPPTIRQRSAEDQRVDPITSNESSITARPEVRAARERVTAANSQIYAEHSLILRQLGATIGTKQSGGQTSMIAGVSLPLPLFDRNRGEIQRARAERDAAQFDLATLERMASGDLQGAYDAAALLTERVTALTKRDTSNFLSRANESRRIALGAYREGAVPLLQVIDAARSWADTRVMYYRTVFAQQQSILTLQVAAGVDLFSVPTTGAASGSSK